MGFGAGFTDLTSLRFLDAHVAVLFPKIVPCTSFIGVVCLSVDQTVWIVAVNRDAGRYVVPDGLVAATVLTGGALKVSFSAYRRFPGARGTMAQGEEAL